MGRLTILSAALNMWIMKRTIAPLDDMIGTTRAKIARLEKTREKVDWAIEKLKIELGAFETARKVVDEAEFGPTPSGCPTPAQFREGANGVVEFIEKRRGRSLSAQWKQVLTAIGKIGESGADLDQVYGLCRDNGIELKRPTLRAQMSNYVSRGYLGRTGEGRFFLTVAGLDVAGLIVPASARESGAPALTGAPGK